MIYVLPYTQGSKSATLLAKELKGKIIKLKNSKFKWNKPTVNWGNQLPKGNCLNRNPSIATNKARCFLELEAADVRTVPWTLDRDEALQWMKDGKTVFARTKVAAQGGAGIVVLNDHPDTTAPLYTQYVKKKVEFRIHVVNGKVIHLQEKKLKVGVEHSLIQSHSNGYIFGKVGHVPDDVITQSINAVKACSLDFGAVDVIWNEKKQEAYILEVNTAPGLSLTTAVKYALAFKEYYNV